MVIVAIIALLIILTIGAAAAINRDGLFRGPVSRPRHMELPHLIIPSSVGAADILPAGCARAREVALSQASPVPMSSPAPAASAPLPTTTTRKEPLPGGFGEHLPERRKRKPRERRTEPSVAHSAKSSVAASAATPVGSAEPEQPSTDATVIFERPANDPVQVLPGRLRVLSGEAAGRELRLFSKVGEVPRILVGREAGPTYHHITLRSPTVSRRHARMELIDGNWTITNLSETNPVLVNNQALTDESSAKQLSNGDCIELGEVALRFMAS